MPPVTASPSRLQRIMQRCADICALVEGIQVVSPLAPQAIYQHPAIVITAGSSVRVGATDALIHTRKININLLTNVYNADYQMMNEANTVPLMDAIDQAFLPRKGLELNDGGLARKAHMGEDAGVTTIKYGGKEYTGCVLTLTVTYDTMRIP